MATLADIRRFALALPGAVEIAYGGARFAVGKKAFVHYWAQEDGFIFKLPHAHQELLFEVRPETFRPYQSGAMRWSWVDVAQLDRGEAKSLVTEAWSTLVPKKLSAALLAGAKP